MQTVIHVLSEDEVEQKTALAIARNLLEDESGTIDEIAVVVQAGGINAIRADGDLGEQVRALLADDVPFRACRNTLGARDMDESDLVDGVETVPEGAVEVTGLQNEGYAYIRP